MAGTIYIYQITPFYKGVVSRKSVSYRTENHPLDKSLIDSFTAEGLEVRLMVLATEADGKRLNLNEYIPQYVADNLGIWGIFEKGIIPKEYLIEKKILSERDVQPSS
jgi:hypothetical protein